MQKILEEIFSIEKRAQGMMKEAEHECELVSQNAKKKQAELKEDIEKRQNARIEKVKKYEADASVQKTEAVSKEHNDALEALQKVFERNKDAWSEEIFRKVIGR